MNKTMMIYAVKLGPFLNRPRHISALDIEDAALKAAKLRDAEQEEHNDPTSGALVISVDSIELLGRFYEI